VPQCFFLWSCVWGLWLKFCLCAGCDAGLHGTFVCPSTGTLYLDWRVWFDVGGLEGNNNSCFRLFHTLVQYAASRTTCASLGAHLLSSQQVRVVCRVHVD
jgi:hypothetical protein